MGTNIGYARISTCGMSVDTQVARLEEFGVELITRDNLPSALGCVGGDDSFVVVKAPVISQGCATVLLETFLELIAKGAKPVFTDHPEAQAVWDEFLQSDAASRTHAIELLEGQ
jgi:hypothetical protein